MSTAFLRQRATARLCANRAPDSLLPNSHSVWEHMNLYKMGSVARIDIGRQRGGSRIQHSVGAWYAYAVKVPNLVPYRWMHLVYITRQLLDTRLSEYIPCVAMMCISSLYVLAAGWGSGNTPIFAGSGEPEHNLPMLFQNTQNVVEIYYYPISKLDHRPRMEQVSLSYSLDEGSEIKQIRLG
ncbi:hypothetical protein BDV12DRAFT_8307 [Aspergillus spectabilis]